MDTGEINKALAAHGIWKVRLHEAIMSGASNFDPEIVSQDQECEFGKWLYSILPRDRSPEFWPQARDLHARFHQEAGRILKLALAGKSDEAHLLIMDLRGEFVSTSVALTNTLYAWKKSST